MVGGMWKAPGVGPVSATAGIGVGEGVGVGDAATQAISSNAPNAKRTGKRNNLRIGEFLYKISVTDNESPLISLSPTSLILENLFAATPCCDKEWP